MTDTSVAREVPRDEWRSFFDGFSRQHTGWTVTVEVTGAGLGTRVEARELPFEGVTLDADGRAVTVMTGASPDRHASHTVAAPARVVLDQSGIHMGTGERLAIESADGTTTLVRFHAPVLPEQLDGVF